MLVSHLAVAIEIEILTSISRVQAQAWDALVGDDNPFLEHAFLSALESSRSVGADAGCLPRLVLARNGGRLIGAVPLYLKTHSYGEYIFDWAWADAAHRAKIRYYPKLVAAVPFTPATGHRLLVAAGEMSRRPGPRSCAACRQSPTKSARRRFTSYFARTASSRRSPAIETPATRRGSACSLDWENRRDEPFESLTTAFRLFDPATASKCAKSVPPPRVID